MTYLLQASICLGIFYTVYHLLLRNLPTFQWNRVYLLVMYGVALTVPILSFDMYPIYVENVSQEVLSSPLVDGLTETNSITSFNYLLGLYFLVVSFFISRLLYNLSLIYIKINKARKISNNQYTLIESDGENKVYSFLKYLIVPKGEKLHPQVIDHEKVHMTQYHSIDLIISEIVKSILWFNPFAYLSQEAIRINHEYICDVSASNSIGRYNYAVLLNKVSYENSQHILVNNFSFKLKNRIMMLQKIDSLKDQKWRYALILPLMLFVMHLYAFETYVITSDNQSSIMRADTIPQIEPIYRIDTTTIFDAQTYEETFTVHKHIIADQITMIDVDTKKEVVSVVPRTEDCYVLLWGNRAFGNGGANEISVSELGKLFNKNTIKIAPIEKECDKVSSWSGRIIFIPLKGDPQVQELTMKNNKVGRTLQKHNSIGTKIFFENFSVNGSTELSGLVLKVK